jgi:hypothetical protein
MATSPRPRSSDPSDRSSSPPAPRSTRPPFGLPQGRRRSRLAASALTLSLAAGTLLATSVARPAEAATSVGAGSYTTTLPAGQSLPTGCGDISTNPRGALTANAPSGPVPTNDWWSSILFKKTDCAFGEPLFAHPAAYDTYPQGLGISYATTPTITGSATAVGEYKLSYTRDILVGVAGLSTGRVQVDDWSDWTVTPTWIDGNRSLKATIGHGLPMSYFEVTGGGNAQISTDGPPRVWSNSGSSIGFSIRDHDYVAYAPAGATWTVNGTSIVSALGGKGYFTVAVLPTKAGDSDSTRTSLASTYGRYAHAHVTDTELSYSYDPGAGAVRSTYAFSTERKEGSESRTVVSLYPHQWKALSGPAPISQS